MARRIRRRDAGRLAIGAGVVALVAGRGNATAYAQAAPAGQSAPAGAQSTAELMRIADDVYVYRSLTHQALFIVTDEGVIATDPIGLQPAWFGPARPGDPHRGQPARALRDLQP